MLTLARAAILACVLLAPPAAAEKTLRYAFQVAETGFDPAQVNDLYSVIIFSHILDAPLTYDYLALPFKLKPNTGAAMPEVSPDGKTWIVRIRPGIYFADDAAFKGRKRELTAQDYVYSLKRHFDPRNKSVQLYLIDKRIVGWTRCARLRSREGSSITTARSRLRAIDRYTFRVVLKEPKPTFIYDLAYCNLSCAVAREVIEAYPDRTMEHPVGTNAYRLTQWKRSSRMVLERNPNYREHFYAEERRPTTRRRRRSRRRCTASACRRSIASRSTSSRSRSRAGSRPQRRARPHRPRPGGVREHRRAARPARAQPAEERIQLDRTQEFDLASSISA